MTVIHAAMKKQQFFLQLLWRSKMVFLTKAIGPWFFCNKIKRINTYILSVLQFLLCNTTQTNSRNKAFLQFSSYKIHPFLGMQSDRSYSICLIRATSPLLKYLHINHTLSLLQGCNRAKRLLNSNYLALVKTEIYNFHMSRFYFKLVIIQL